MRGTAASGLLIVVILVGAGAGYLFGNVNERTVTSTNTTVSTTTVTTSIVVALDIINSYISDNGICNHNGVYVPCLGSPAHVFNSCPNLLVGPPAPYTCTYTVKSAFPYPSYTINITLGVSGQATEPQWANCTLLDATKMVSYADCIPVINSTAFIVGEPASPPQ
jgi:hypothetical protein